MADKELQDEEDEETQEPLLGSKQLQPEIRPPESQEKRKEMVKVEPITPQPCKDICTDLMGDWGWWQLRATLIIYLTKIPAAWFMACIIFTAPLPWYGEYTCDLSYFPDRVNSSLNETHPTKLTPSGSHQYEYCYVYDTVKEQNESDSWITKVATKDSLDSVTHCENFNFHIDRATTLITRFDLVCSKTILVAITQCFHLFGVLLGGIIATELMQYSSPRRVMMAGMILQILCGLATGYVPWFWLHVAFRCAAAACCAITFTPGGAILGDIVGGRQKTIAGANFEHFWSIGVILLPLIGYLTRTWSEIYITISVPTILIMFLWIWMPDSPRWHLERGDVEKARKILEQAVIVNNTKRTLPDNLDELLKIQALNAIGKKSVDSKIGWRQLLSLPGAPWKVIIILTAWSLIFTCYYGTLLNIRSFGRAHLFYTTAITGVCEIIGGFIGFLIIMKSKNKWNWIGCITIVAGLVNSVIWLMPVNADGSHNIVDLMCIAMINKIGISICLWLLTNCTAELIPLPHKKRIIFSSTCMARTVFITAPLIGFTAMYGDAVSLTFFGVMTSVTGILTLLMSPIKEKVVDKGNNGAPNIWTVKLEANELTKL